MIRYLGKRILAGIAVVFASLCINFMLIRLAPGTPAQMIAGLDNPNPEQIEALTIKYGLDKSLWEQFISYMENLLHGDLGYSYVKNRPVIDMITEKIVPTLLLSFGGLLFALFLGTFLGTYCARKKGTLTDKALCALSYLFDSTPSFWLGLMLMLVFASRLGWFPTSGMRDMREQYEGAAYVLDVLHHLVLPMLTLAFVQFPYYFRITRASILQVMSEDFIVTLRASGMKESMIFNKYVLRNALIPTITVLGSSLAFLLSGSVYIETIFSWPGMGRLLFNSIAKRDYPMLSGIYLMISAIVAITMILLDVVYSLVDPRIKMDKEGQ